MPRNRDSIGTDIRCAPATLDPLDGVRPQLVGRYRNMPRARGRVLVTLAQVHGRLRRVEAMPLYREAERLFRAMGHERLTADILCEMAQIKSLTQDPERRAQLGEPRPVSVMLGDALARYRLVFPPDNPRLLDLTLNLVQTDYPERTGTTPESMLAEVESQLNPENEEHDVIREVLIRTRALIAGDFMTSRTLFQQVVASRRAKHGNDSRFVLESLAHLCMTSRLLED